MWHLKDWEHWLDNLQIGPVAFQFGNRPLLTKETPTSVKWTNKLLTLEGVVYHAAQMQLVIPQTGCLSIFVFEVKHRSKFGLIYR